jgi:GTP-binding protein EngB required for normal cell division
MNIAVKKKDDIDKLVKIVFIGSTEVGKSCLLKALTG